MRPEFHRLARKLTAVVRGDRLRCTAECYQPVQMFCDLLARLRAVGMHAQTLSGVLIDDRQNSKTSSVRQPLAHKVPAPTLGARFPIQTVNAFGVYAPTFSPQQHRQSSITVPNPRAGQIPQPNA